MIERPIQVLVTEDEEILRELLVDTLSAEGYVVHAATTGAETRQLIEAQAESLDAILLDRLLPACRVALRKDGRVVDTGVGANVLDGPAHALAHLRDVLASQPDSRPLAAGELVTTGTITDAWPVARGDTWTSDYGALPVRGLALAIR